MINPEIIQALSAASNLAIKLLPSIQNWANSRNDDQLVEDFRQLVTDKDFQAWADDLKKKGRALLDGE